MKPPRLPFIKIVEVLLAGFFLTAFTFSPALNPVQLSVSVFQHLSPEIISSTIPPAEEIQHDQKIENLLKAYLLTSRSV